MRSHVLWTGCMILVGFSLAIHAYINNADEESTYRRQHRNRLVAAGTMSRTHTVYLPQMEQMDMSGATSRSSELIRQFIPFDKSSTPVVCPDHESTCPENTTCCLMADGEDFGCCPAPKAVCCNDHIHCCPNGMACDIEDEMCKAKDDSSVTLRLLRKIPSMRLQPNIVCPDTKSSCPDRTTCCQDQSGQYQCCPAPDAVCCSDHIHCCPNGMKCDLQDLTCNSHSATSRLLRKLPATRLSVGDEILCPDNQSTCPQQMTCCQDDDNSYSCCPSLSAVCCSDQIHCCPSGMECDVKEQQCKESNGLAATRFLRKLPAKRIVRKTGVLTTSAYHNCAGLQANKRSPFSCPSGSSCCVNDRLDSVSCCPHANGECCSNGECCPSGFKCTDSGECTMVTRLITAAPKLLFEATKEKWNAHGTVVTICEDNSECPGRSTCCPVINSIDGTVESYRCCGLSLAFCCGVDSNFCCPYGYQCARGRHCERAAPADMFTN